MNELNVSVTKKSCCAGFWIECTICEVNLNYLMITVVDGGSLFPQKPDCSLKTALPCSTLSLEE